MIYDILFLLLLAIVSSCAQSSDEDRSNINPSLISTCWNHSSMPIECKNRTTLDGNIAFPVVSSDDVFDLAETITTQFREFDPINYKTSSDRRDYHISIDYMFCVTENYTDLVHEALDSFDWDSFTLTTGSICCEPGYLELCLDDESQQVMYQFATKMRDHIKSYGVPIPNYRDYQPPFHISLGETSKDYNFTAAISSIQNRINTQTSFQVDVLYFGKEPYRADNYFLSPGGSSKLAIGAVIGIAVGGFVLIGLIICLVRLCQHVKK